MKIVILKQSNKLYIHLFFDQDFDNLETSIISFKKSIQDKYEIFFQTGKESNYYLSSNLELHEIKKHSEEYNFF